MNLIFTKDRMLHRLKARNGHGLYSPFVFRLLNEVVYNFEDDNTYAELALTAKNLPMGNNKPFPRKVNRLIYKLVTHFKPKKFAVIGSVDRAVTHYAFNTSIGNVNFVNDAVFADCIICDVYDQPVNLDKLRADSFAIVTNIYKGTTAKAHWRLIKQQSRVTVAIDLFYVGLVFCNAGPGREHFRLKW